MTSLPPRSPGVLLAPLADQAVAYDPATETAYHLNATAGTVLSNCDGTTGLDQAVSGWAQATGANTAVVAADVKAGLDTLTELGLVGRTSDYSAPKPPVGCTAEARPDAMYGAVHRVIDWAITFRSSQPELLEQIDAFLGTGTSAATGAALTFDVCEHDNGQVLLLTDYEWLFPDRRAFFNQLTSIMNEYAVWTHTCASLHAGAVRSPDGDVVLLPAVSGSGKSTLTGAFVSAGWDYLGDEAIGIRAETLTAVGYPKRLAIGATSRSILGLPASEAWDLDPADLRPDVIRLGGDVGPVTRVVLPTYAEGTELGFSHLDSFKSFDALLANILNLGRAGQSAFDALCDLAAHVPVGRLVHDDAHRAVFDITRQRFGPAAQVGAQHPTDID